MTSRRWMGGLVAVVSSGVIWGFPGVSSGQEAGALVAPDEELGLAATGLAPRPSPILVTGSVDAYSSLNLTHGSVEGASNELHAFDTNANDFSFSYAKVAIERPAAPVGFRLDVVLGPTADLINLTDSTAGAGYDVMKHLQQAYVSWRPTPSLTIKLGKMVTYFGQELIESQLNVNYTHGLLFTWANPYTQTGVQVTVAATDALDLSVFLLNGVNNSVDGNDFKSPGVQAIVRATPALTLIANYGVFNELAGPQGDLLDFGDALHLIDLIATIAASERLELALNSGIGIDAALEEDQTFVGVAAYGRVRTTDRTRASLRLEYFADSASPILGLPGVVGELVEATGTFSFAPADGLLLRAEGRVDHALGGYEPFTDADGVAAATADQVTITLGAVATF